MNIVVIVLAIAQVVTLHFTCKELDKCKARLTALEPLEEKEGD